MTGVNDMNKKHFTPRTVAWVVTFVVFCTTVALFGLVWSLN